MLTSNRANDEMNTNTYSRQNTPRLAAPFSLVGFTAETNSKPVKRRSILVEIDEDLISDLAPGFIPLNPLEIQFVKDLVASNREKALEAYFASIGPATKEVYEERRKNYKKWMARSTWEVSPRPLWFTPRMAFDFLFYLNDRNRVIKDNRVDNHVNTMKGGGWGVIGDSIAVYTDGSQANAQHRLAGVALSGLPQRFLLFLGVTRKDGEQEGTAVKRTYKDLLEIRKVKNAKKRQEIVNIIARNVEGRRDAEDQWSKDQIHAADKDGIGWAAATFSGRKYKADQHAPVAAAFAKAYLVDTTVVAKLAHRVRTGEGLKIGHADYAIWSAIDDFNKWLINAPKGNSKKVLESGVERKSVEMQRKMLLMAVAAGIKAELLRQPLKTLPLDEKTLIAGEAAFVWFETQQD